MKGLLTSLITVLTFTGLQAQSLPAAPKLVVGLTIDQLRWLLRQLLFRKKIYWRNRLYRQITNRLN